LAGARRGSSGQLRARFGGSQEVALPDADLGDLTTWIVDHRYLPTSGLGGTWVRFHGARREARAPADDRSPAAAVSWWTYEPPEVAFILSPNTPIAGWSWADLTHGHRGGAREVAVRWGAPPPG
jgi:hypothetical protein